MNRTPIEWTDFSANPVRFRTADNRVVWACEKLSPGCANCYAEDLSHRYGGTRRAGDWNAHTMATLTPFLDEKELRLMLTYKPASGKRVFVEDMSDLFGAWVPDALLDQLFAVFALRQDVTFQVLTKRADRAHAYLSDPDMWLRIAGPLMQMARGYAAAEAAAVDIAHRSVRREPLSNVWLGVSVEDQQRADERIPLLLQTPAAVRFISAEPLLGPVNLLKLDVGGGCDWNAVSGTSVRYGAGGRTVCYPYDAGQLPARLDWVIVGGESGTGARPFDIRWARSIVQQCQAAGVPVFVKQLGQNAVCRNDERDEGWPGCTVPIDDDYEPREQGEIAPLVFRDRKGGEPTEWSEDLRVREFPRAGIS